MYTSHGHQIVNTTVEGEPPFFVRSCGGPARCRTCKLESDYYNTQVEGAVTVELGPATLQAIQRTIALGLDQRPRVQFRNLNTATAIKKVTDVIDASMSVTVSDHGRLLKELLEAGIEFYYYPEARS